MIVADKEKSIAKAHEISNKILKIITDEIQNNELQEDPAEIIYLTNHIIGNLLAKHCLSLQCYGKVYAISELTTDLVMKWIETISKEYIELNKDIL